MVERANILVKRAAGVDDDVTLSHQNTCFAHEGFCLHQEH